MSELFNTEAEVAILSLVFNSPNLIYNLLNVKPNMYSMKPHQAVFGVMEDLVMKGLVPDFHLVETYCKENGLLEEVGGVEYLNYLVAQKFDPLNLKEYENMVVSGYKARVLLAVTAQFPSMLTNSSSVNSAINYLQKELDIVSSNSGGELTVELASDLNSVWQNLEYRKEHPGLRGVTSGIRDVDMVLSGINKGEPMVIGGRPGMGKTAFICNMALFGAEAGVKSLIFSLEMNRQALIERFLSIKTGIPLTPNIRIGNLSNAELETISATLKEFKKLPILIDSNFDADIGYLESTMRKFKKTHDIDVVYLDYIQLMARDVVNPVQEIGMITRKLKKLSNELDIGVIATSQLNRLLELRDDKRPILSDYRQSGNVEEDFDICVGLYRDEKYNKDTRDKSVLEYIILKNRQGPVGKIPLRFKEETNLVYCK